MSTHINQVDLTPELTKYIYDRFNQHSVMATGVGGFTEEVISFEMREGDELIGVIVSQMFWGYIHIRWLVVEEAHRNKGYATKLMEHALEYGKKQGSRFASVNTLSFQALEFYQKLGFKIDFKRDGYDQGVSMYFLSKSLNHTVILANCLVPAKAGTRTQ